VRPDPYGLPTAMRAALTHQHIPLLCQLIAPLHLTSLSLAASHITDDSVALLVEVRRPPNPPEAEKKPFRISVSSRAVERSRESPPHRPRENGLNHSVDTSRSNLAEALGRGGFPNPSPYPPTLVP
jgi:hypothetical protein